MPPRFQGSNRKSTRTSVNGSRIEGYTRRSYRFGCNVYVEASSRLQLQVPTTCVVTLPRLSGQFTSVLGENLKTLVVTNPCGGVSTQHESACYQKGIETIEEQDQQNQSTSGFSTRRESVVFERTGYAWARGCTGFIVAVPVNVGQCHGAGMVHCCDVILRIQPWNNRMI